jgi:hypothetical protein
MKKHLIAAAVLALGFVGVAHAESNEDPNEDPLLGPKAQQQLAQTYGIHVDPVAAAIVEQMRQCVATDAWRKPPHPTGVALTDGCYREARGMR